MRRSRPSGRAVEPACRVRRRPWNRGAEASAVGGPGMPESRRGRGIKNETPPGPRQQAQADSDPREFPRDRAAGGKGCKVPQPGSQLVLRVACCSRRDLQQFPVEVADQSCHFAFSPGPLTGQGPLEGSADVDKLPDKYLSSGRSYHSGSEWWTPGSPPRRGDAHDGIRAGERRCG